MDRDIKRRQSFLLRLPLSVRERAAALAQNEGTSLNHFIALAVAEKIGRMEQFQLPPGRSLKPPQFGIRQA